MFSKYFTSMKIKIKNSGNFIFSKMFKKNSIFIKKFEILKKYFSGKLKFPEFIFYFFRRKNIFYTHKKCFAKIKFDFLRPL